jgi:glycosyltransferase involved in cell wall biosynthesis
MKTSVAMCTYNGEDYLLEQLQSILFQTKSIDEIVICDDCSTDKTLEIVQRFKEKCPVPVIVKENAGNIGYTKNFEQAISQCSGDIIFLSDQDDIWMPEKVSVICDFFDNHPDVSFLFTNAQLINTIGANSYDKTLFDAVGWNKKTKKLFQEGYGYEVLATSGRVTGATTALRASFIPYCIPFPQTSISIVHDECIAVIAMLHDKIAYIEECLIKYRLHYKQSVGLGVLLKYPPRTWELSKNILMHHQELVEPHCHYSKSKLLFVYKRFYTIREHYGIIKLFNLFLKGEYKKFYFDNSLSVLKKDIKSVLIRLLTAIKSKIAYTKMYN